MARSRTAAQMTRLVAQWRASGESQARFARRHGVRPWTLWYWSRKPGPASTPTFVPVQLAPPPDPPPIEIVLPDGVRIVARADTSPTVVAAVVAALRAPC